MWHCSIWQGCAVVVWTIPGLCVLFSFCVVSTWLESSFSRVLVSCGMLYGVVYWSDIDVYGICGDLCGHSISVPPCVDS